MNCNDRHSEKTLQKHGLLLKKSISRWSKRFMVLKDGFLFMYNENERREFEKKPVFNYHPKAVIPVGHAKILQTPESGQPFAFIIRTDQPDTADVILATDSQYSMECWIEMLQRSTLITWSNFQLTDQLIRGFESCGLQLAADKQNFQEKLQVESLALLDEKQKSEELEQVKLRLQEERDKMKEFTLNLKNDYDKIKTALEETSDIMSSLENENKTLSNATSCLQGKLENLEDEKETTLGELKNRHHQIKLKESETANLMENLLRIEEERSNMQKEKLEMSKMLKDNEHQKQELIIESKQITHNARQLEHQISVQKSVTEQELKDEILARMQAENRLKNAESALNRIEKNLSHRFEKRSSTTSTPDKVKSTDVGRVETTLETSQLAEVAAANDDIMVDVKSLKKFFEKLVSEESPNLMSRELQTKKLNQRRTQNDRIVASIRHKKSRSMCYASLKAVFEPPTKL